MIRSKQEQVEDYLREQIVCGRWMPGQKVPSEGKLTQLLDVSQNTLRLGLRALVLEGLLERKQRSGTVVKKSIATIAILAHADAVMSPLGYNYKRLLEESMKLIHDANFNSVLYLGHGETVDEFVESLGLFEKAKLRNVVGLISFWALGKYQTELIKNRIPAVSLTSDGISPDDFSVVWDVDKLFTMGMTFLGDMGYKKVAVMLPGGKDIIDPLINNFATLLKKLDLSIQTQWVPVPGSMQREQAFERFRQLWNSKDRPEAVFFLEDCIFDVASRYILEKRISVPDDLGILTHHFQGRPTYFPVPLYSLEHDATEAIKQVWEMLQGMMNSNTAISKLVRISPHIDKGESLYMR